MGTIQHFLTTERDRQYKAVLRPGIDVTTLNAFVPGVEDWTQEIQKQEGGGLPGALEDSLPPLIGASAAGVALLFNAPALLVLAVGAGAYVLSKSLIGDADGSESAPDGDGAAELPNEDSDLDPDGPAAT